MAWGQGKEGLDSADQTADFHRLEAIVKLSVRRIR